jgi:hypothetical protein
MYQGQIQEYSGGKIEKKRKSTVVHPPATGFVAFNQVQPAILQTEDTQK